MIKCKKKRSIPVTLVLKKYRETELIETRFLKLHSIVLNAFLFDFKFLLQQNEKIIFGRFIDYIEKTWTLIHHKHLTHQTKMFIS